MRGTLRLLILVAVLALVLTGCTSRSTATATMSAVASFYPLFEFSQRIGGDRVSVRNLVPAGTESHDYEPTPKDLADLTRARIVIYNGAGFEPWLEKLLPEVPPVVVRVNATEGLVLSTPGGDPLKGSESVGRGRRLPDPHVWLDPVIAEHQVALILAGLVKADPDGRRFYEANAARLREDLQALHQQFTATLRTCRKKEFITSHAAFGYLARRYGLVQIAISGLTPQAEPSPSRLAAVAQLARQHGIRVVYYETLVSPRVAETIAREVGARVLVLNPLEGLTSQEQREGRNYFTVMHENLRNLAEGLDCSR